MMATWQQVRKSALGTLAIALALSLSVFWMEAPASAQNAPVTTPAQQKNTAPAPVQAAPVEQKKEDAEKKKDDDKGGFWDGGGAVLLGTLPTLVWALFAGWALCLFFPQVIALLGRLKAFKGLGVEIEFGLEERLEEAAEKQQVIVTPAQVEALMKRVSREGALVKGMRVLWVDDNPNNNTNEVLFLQGLGVNTTKSTTTADAITKMARGRRFDLVISDMVRAGDAQAGLALRDNMRAAATQIPLVIYCGTDQRGQDRPADLFGITNRPDELLHLVFDARERHA